MSISIVLCTYNRHEGLKKNLDSIYANTTKPLEIIVVDQSNNYLTQNLIKKLKRKSKISLRYIRDNKTGLSHARNIGWQAARGKIIAFSDDDAYVNQGWVENINNAFNNKKLNAGVVGGKIIPLFPANKSSWPHPMQWAYTLPSLDHGNRIIKYPNGSLPPGVNYAILKKILVKNKGFDERLGVNVGRRVQIFGEDSAMSLKAQSLGFSLIYHPKVVCYHPVSPYRLTYTFLLKRLFFEGVTDTCVSYTVSHQRKRHSLQKLKKTSGYIFELLLKGHPEGKKTRDGQIARSLGNIYALVYYGMFSKEFRIPKRSV